MMKTKSFRRILGFALAMVLILSCIGPASAVVLPPADTDAVQMYLSGSATYPRGIYAVLNPEEDLTVRYNVPYTDVRHVVGTGLEISVPYTQTYTASILGNFYCNGAAQLGADIAASAQNAFTGVLRNQLGLTEVETHVLYPHIDYTLDSDEPNGVYCLAVFFPGKEVIKKVTGVNSNQLAVSLWQETAEYVPLSGESYAKIVLYVE